MDDVIMKLNSKTGHNDFEVDREGIAENMLAIAKNKDIGALYFDENSVISTFKISGEYCDNKNKHFFNHMKRVTNYCMRKTNILSILKA